MNLYPNVEQVGFLEKNKLTMAGGEFCGNATRSAALILLKGRPGKINLKVSGVKNYLKAGIRKNGETYSEMPIFNDVNKVISIPNTNSTEFLVEMQGIYHLINFNYKQIENLSTDEIKKQAKSRIEQLNLNKLSAVGIIYVNQKKEQYLITPVVYVRKIDTLFLETACGSGSTALGLVLVKNRKSSINLIPIIQPSGMSIKISIDYKNNSFKKAFIQGPCEIITNNESLNVKIQL